jgi:hypothetical protein
MKIAYIFLLLAVDFVCHTSYPDSATILCDLANCESYIDPGGLVYKFTGSSYTYFGKRRTIAIWCNVRNYGVDTLIFYRWNYKIISSKDNFLPEPSGIVKNGKYSEMPDSIRLLPGDFLDYNFEYKSEGKMTKENYDQVTVTDTINFVRIEKNGNAEKILRVIRIPK